MFTTILTAWRNRFYRQFLALFLAITLILLVKTYVTDTSYRRMLDNFGWVERTLLIQEELDRISRDMVLAESAKRAYLASGAPHFQERFQSYQVALRGDLERAATLITDTIQKDNHSRLIEQVQLRLQSFDETQYVAAVPLPAESLTLLLDQGSAVSERIHGLLDTMYARQHVLLDQRRARANRSYRLIRQLTFGSNALVISLSLLAILLLALEIRRRNRVERSLTAASQNKDKFFSIISHDLRSPFASIMGLSDLMMDKSLDLEKEKLSHMSRLLNETTKNTYQLLQNLLDWSRLQMEHYQVRLETVDAGEIIRQELSFQAPVAAKKNITLRPPAFGPLPVRADRDMLATVVRNLLSNAIKFTPHNGTVSVTALTRDDRIEVAVADTGVGIPASLRDKLFQIDQHTSSKGTDKEKGTGLGLILCREFLDKMGGRIRFTSELNQGTTFYFTLHTA